MNTKILLLLALGATISTQLSTAQTKPQEARDVLDQWVETRQIISKEQSDWRVEKSILEDTKMLLSSELERIEKELTDLEETATAADEDRTELAAEKETLSSASNVVESNIGALETKVKAIVKTLPEPLVDKLKPLIRRLPEDSENTKLSLGERVQNIVGILSQADKFNGTVTQTSESREIDGGKTVEVRTLYWGLATAYYVDASGEYSGIGYPTEDGWEWPKVEGAGEAIIQLIEVYEGTGDIVFVEAPARIK
ncbi:MAG: DUF3450 family protein [Verrucomicrobiota bacterium]